MSKAIRTTLSLVVSLVLYSALAMAQAGGNNVDQNKNQEHHSRMAKAAFWRHHKDTDKNAKQAPSTQAAPKQAPQKAEMKPVSAKQGTGSKDQKQAQQANNVKKPAAKKAPAVGKTPAASKTEHQQKAQDPKTASLKQ